MDLTALIPISAIVIGIPSFLGFIALIMSHSRKVKELELRERELELGGGDASLMHELDRVRAQMAELHERLSATERLLSSGTPKRD